MPFACRARIDDIVNGSGALTILMGAEHNQPNRVAYETVYIQVPAGRIGLVIGKGGETIKDLQAKTGAKVQVNREDRDGPMRTVIVNGSQKQIAAAQKEIDEIVSGAGYYGPGGANSQQETIRVAKDKIGLIIGKGGEAIKQIQGECRVKLNIEQNADLDGERVVTIFGSAEGIAMAKEMIDEKIGLRKTLDESQLGVQIDRDYASVDPAYAAAYGSGVVATGKTLSKEDLAMYVDSYKRYYESMGYNFPDGFDLEEYLSTALK